MIDEAKNVRKGEALNLTILNNYLKSNIDGFTDLLSIQQFPGGFSNLTYLLTTREKEYVLRKPPIGANIKSAHDMHREFKVLTMLYPIYKKVPIPTFYCDDHQIVGSSFYLMERVRGVILRQNPPKSLDLSPNVMNAISLNCIAELAKLHQLDINDSGLSKLGKPIGYTQRQVDGWIKRYKKAATDDIQVVNHIMEWLPSNITLNSKVALIHNDYKYDNLVLDETDLTCIKAILDWEMATIGDPLMDFGTTLAYWSEAKDQDAIKPFNLTWMPGNLTREQVIDKYFGDVGQPIQPMLFYYVFGCFKIAVIVQQIYARYRKGLTSDERFKHLNFVVNAMCENGAKAIALNRISHLY